MKHAFHTKITLKFRDADPAQIMYFANIFSLAHDCFEEFIVAAGYEWSEWFNPHDYMIPIRHTEADFKIPFFPGQTYEVAVTVASFGETSFKMHYVFSQNGKTHAHVNMVHTVLDIKTKEKVKLPDLMRKRLGHFLEQKEQ